MTAALKSSHNYNFDFINGLALPSFVIYGDQIILNHKAQKLLSYDAQEFLNTSQAFETFFREQNTWAKIYHEKEKNRKFPEKLRFQFYDKFDKQFTIECHIQLNELSSTESYELWLLNDITEHLLSEQKFSTLFETSSNAHIVIDHRGIIECNQAAIEMLGLKSKFDLLFHQLLEFSPQKQSNGVASDVLLEMMSSVAMTKKSHRFEWTFNKLDLHTFPVEMTFSYIHLGNQDVLVASWQDLSEIRKKSQFIEKITNTIPTMIYVYDLKNKNLVYANDVSTDIWGYAIEEIRAYGERLLDTKLHPDDLAKRDIDLGRVLMLQDGEFYQYEYRIKKKDETYLYCDARLTVFERDERGTPTQLLAVCQDVSKEKQLAIDLDKEKIRSFTSSKMAALGEMAGGIAHEINNPLAIIRGKATQIKLRISQDKLDTEKTNSDLDKIATMVDRISKIIRGLRNFSRNGESDPLEWAPLQQIIDDSVELCQAKFKHHEVEFVIQNHCPKHEVLCRAVQLSQVLLNLLNNSFDAIQTLPKKWIKLEIDIDPHKGFYISVTDSGPGIPAHIREKLMQPFFTTKDVGKGTGLGLSISKGIIDELGGYFYIDEYCSNTKFVIRIPQEKLRTPTTA